MINYALLFLINTNPIPPQTGKLKKVYEMSRDTCITHAAKMWIENWDKGYYVWTYCVIDNSGFYTKVEQLICDNHYNCKTNAGLMS